LRRQLTLDDYVAGLEAGDRTILARAITLLESRNPDHQSLAQDVLTAVLPKTGAARRIGITGVPGVGKSTFIDAFGTFLTDREKEVAVLAVDPSSTRTGGSILGDKTRMARLSIDPNAFVRPSPSAGSLGGVARATRETTLLCEAAGFDTILIETVGVGQSEVTVAGMVDFFLVLMLPGAGDDLQGIKKGILEIADMIVVNKADGSNEIKAKQAARDYAGALHMMKAISPNWNPPVETCSAMLGKGLDEIWGSISSYYQKLSDSGELQDKRQQQQIDWTWSMLEGQLLDQLRSNKKVAELIPSIEAKILASQMTPVRAVEQLLRAFST